MFTMRKEGITRIVVNTSPLITLTAAIGTLDVLQFLYAQVVVPFEVAEEVRMGGATAFGVDVFEHATWLDIREKPLCLLPFLQNSLDSGEAAVIQTAMQDGIERVCIDEALGRRVARLSNLTVTGSIGVLLKAKSLGYRVSMPDAIQRMQKHGIWLSQSIIDYALLHE